MSLRRDSPLFILAMDQRASFARDLFGVDGDPTEAERTKMRDAKMVIYEGARRAVADGLTTGRPGVLVDEELGAEVARRAKADGFVLAMPIEKSGTELFELEYGDRYPEHVEAFDPDFFKVLVRYNPADAPDDAGGPDRTAGRGVDLGCSYGATVALRAPGPSHAGAAGAERGPVPLRPRRPAAADCRDDRVVQRGRGPSDGLETRRL